jgi:hypothetical protein
MWSLAEGGVEVPVIATPEVITDIAPACCTTAIALGGPSALETKPSSADRSDDVPAPDFAAATAGGRTQQSQATASAIMAPVRLTVECTEDP